MHPLTTASLAEQRRCDRVRRSDEMRMVEAARTARAMWQPPRRRWFGWLRPAFLRARSDGDRLVGEWLAVDACGRERSLSV